MVDKILITQNVTVINGTLVCRSRRPGGASVFGVVRSRGLWPAVTAAACYAVFVPAAVSEHTTSLEAVGSVCLLGSVALLTLGPGRRSGSVVPLLAAGALLGVAAGTKIWGVAVVLALVAWSVRPVGVRRAALVLAGAIGGTVAAARLRRYDLQPAAGRRLSRPRNAQWQRFIHDHLANGQIAVVVRFRTSAGLGLPTRESIASWPVLATVAGYQLRRPVPRRSTDA